MEEKKLNGLTYITQFPEDFDENKKYPILLHLHGSGTRGKIESLRNASLLRAVKERKVPLVAVAPLCDAGATWFDHFHQLKELVKHLTTLPYADPDRLYLTGNSMGGYGAWQLAMSLPEYFAALVPICGGGIYGFGKRLVDVPVWAFHGALDPTVLPEESERMVAAINKRGGNAKLTIFPENAHNSWDDTYAHPEVFEWMLAQKRGAKEAPEDEYKNAEIYG